MRRMQFWAILKEIQRNVDDWSDEEFNNHMKSKEIVFRKFLPQSGDWHKSEAHTIRIILETESI